MRRRRLNCCVLVAPSGRLPRVRGTLVRRSAGLSRIWVDLVVPAPDRLTEWDSRIRVSPVGHPHAESRIGRGCAGHRVGGMGGTECPIRSAWCRHPRRSSPTRSRPTASHATTDRARRGCTLSQHAGRAGRRTCRGGVRCRTGERAADGQRSAHPVDLLRCYGGCRSERVFATTPKAPRPRHREATIDSCTSRGRTGAGAFCAEVELRDAPKCLPA